MLIDRERVVEVVDNLVGNAIKYTQPGGTVRVFCEVTNDEVVTNVQDTGQGLYEDEIRIVFDGLRRLSATPTAGESTTGLGLAIVRKIVELHGGRVWARSKKGEGSTFQLFDSRAEFSSSRARFKRKVGSRCSVPQRYPLAHCNDPMIVVCSRRHAGGQKNGA